MKQIAQAVDLSVDNVVIAGDSSALHADADAIEHSCGVAVRNHPGAAEDIFKPVLDNEKLVAEVSATKGILADIRPGCPIAVL